MVNYRNECEEKVQNMGKLSKDLKQSMAIEYIATNPDTTNREMAKVLGMDEKTIGKWRNDPKFIEFVYDRFMEITGKYLPGVIMAQVREALEGNTKSAELILKHFGKMQDTLVVKVESPFMQHLNNANIEDAEVVDKKQAIEIGNSFEIPENINLPERNPDNDHPLKKVREDNKRFRDAKKKAERSKMRKASYLWKKRADKVGVEPLPNHRVPKNRRLAWKNKIIKLEKEMGIFIPKKKPLK